MTDPTPFREMARALHAAYCVGPVTDQYDTGMDGIVILNLERHIRAQVAAEIEALSDYWRVDDSPYAPTSWHSGWIDAIRAAVVTARGEKP